MENLTPFFDYNDDLLERIAAQRLIRAALERFRDEGGFTTVVDAETYVSRGASVARYDEEAAALARRVAPAQAKLAAVSDALNRISRLGTDCDIRDILPYLCLRRALVSQLPVADYEGTNAVVVCDLVMGCLLAGQGQAALALWKHHTSQQRAPLAAVGDATDVIESALSLLPPITAKLAGSRILADRGAAWVPFGLGLLQGPDALERFESTVSSPRLARRVGLVVALAGMERLTALRAKAQKLERRMAHLAKTTRAAVSADALEATVSEARSLSARLARVQDARAHAAATVREVVTRAVFSSPSLTSDALTQHAAFALALFALVWNRLNASEVSINPAGLTDVPHLLGTVVLRSAFSSSGTRRVLLWCILELCGGHSVKTRCAKGVALWQDAVVLPRSLGTEFCGDENEKAEAEGDLSPHRLEAVYLADPELPMTCVSPGESSAV